MTTAKKKVTNTEETTAVATKAPQELAPSNGPIWGNENIDSADIMIPKILLMQGLSEAVNDGKAAQGDMIDSLETKKLGDRNSPVEIIPICTNKTWIVSRKEKKASKFEYVETIPMTAENSKLAMEEEEKDGSVIRRDRSLNFYVLLASDVEGLPYVVSFRRTSYTAGKKLITHFQKMQMLRQPPAAKTLMLSCVQDKNDMGTYFKFDVSTGRVSKPEEVATAKQWYETIQGGVKVDESDVKAAPVESTNFDDEGTADF